MALTINAACSKAALDGMTALFASGSFLFTTSGDVELAVLPISAVGAGTSANPSVGVLSLTADTTVTAGTIAKFVIRTSGAATRINGSVGVGTGDLQVTDNVVPSGATEVSCSAGISLSLTLA